MCATGSEALRNACYAVASGAFDVAMAIGVEKLKDSGFSGLVVEPPIPGDGTLPETTAPARFSLLAPAYAKKYGVDEAEMKDVLTRIAWKNHVNGARNPRAQFRKEVAEGDDRRRRPPIAGHARRLRLLGRVRRLGGGDRGPGRGRAPLHRQAALREGPVVRRRAGAGQHRPGLRLHDVPRGRRRGRATPTRQAGVTDPRAELAMAEVHDCFTPTELVLMEDLGFAERGSGWKEVLAGTFDLDGELPVNPDGGLKAFGHPIGASGLRMMFECWLQLRGEAPAGAAHRHRRRRAQARPHPQPRRPAGRVRELRLRRRDRAERMTLTEDDEARGAGRLRRRDAGR